MKRNNSSSLQIKAAGYRVDTVSGGCKNSEDTNIQNKSILSHSLMGRFQRKHKSNATRWNELLRLYRIAKLTTKLIDKYSLIRLSELTGFKASYISGVEGFHIKPNEDFIKAMENLNDTTL